VITFGKNEFVPKFTLDSLKIVRHDDVRHIVRKMGHGSFDIFNVIIETCVVFAYVNRRALF
jgi:hypothetical protein